MPTGASPRSVYRLPAEAEVSRDACLLALLQLMADVPQLPFQQCRPLEGICGCSVDRMKILRKLLILPLQHADLQAHSCCLNPDGNTAALSSRNMHPYAHAHEGCLQRLCLFLYKLCICSAEVCAVSACMHRVSKGAAA